MRDDRFIKITKEEEALIQRLMTMNFKYHVIQSVIDIVSLCGGRIIGLAKTKKNEWEIPAIIPPMPIVGVNHCVPILHLSKRMVHI